MLLDIAYNNLKQSEIDFSFIMDLIRGEGYSELSRQYEIYRSVAQKYQIRGVGLAGNETKHGLSNDLIPIFKQAKADGFGITIHASEHGDLSNVKKAITKFGADRIGHANFFLLGDHDLSETVKSHGTFFELCPASISIFHENGNQEIGTSIYTFLRADVLNRIYGDIELPEYVQFNINSDDTGMYGQTLSEVFEKMDIWADFRPLDLLFMNESAIDASFADEKTKEKLKSKLMSSLQQSK